MATEADEIAHTMLEGYQASLDSVGLGPTLDDARNYVMRQYASQGGWEDWLSVVMLDNVAQSLYMAAHPVARRHSPKVF